MPWQTDGRKKLRSLQFCAPRSKRKHFEVRIEWSFHSIPEIAIVSLLSRGDSFQVISLLHELILRHMTTRRKRRRRRLQTWWSWPDYIIVFSSITKWLAQKKVFSFISFLFFAEEENSFSPCRGFEKIGRSWKMGPKDWLTRRLANSLSAIAS